MAESGGRAVERKLTIPVAPKAAMIGVKPLFNDKNVAEGDPANFDVAFVAPDGKALARDGLRYELLKLESRYQWYRQGSSWDYEPVKSTKRVADGEVSVAADKPGRIQVSPQPGRYRLDVKEGERRRRADLGDLRCRLVFGRLGRHARSARNLDRQGRVSVRRHHGGERHRAHRRQADHQRRRRPPAHDAVLERQGRRARRSASRSARTGAPAPMWSRPCAGRSTRLRSACPDAPSG